MRMNTFDTTAKKTEFKNGAFQYAHIYFSGSPYTLPTRATTKANGLYDYGGFKTTVSGGVETATYISNSRIALRGLAVDDNLFPYDEFEIGATVASQLNMNLLNQDGVLDGFDFIGCAVQVYVTTSTTALGATSNVDKSIYFDRYIIDRSSENDGTVSLMGYNEVAYMLGRPFSTTLSFGTHTLKEIVHDIAVKLGFGSNPSFANDSVELKALPQGVYTYRDMLRWIGQMAGGFARVKASAIGALSPTPGISFVTPNPTTSVETIYRADMLSDSFSKSPIKMKGTSAILKDGNTYTECTHGNSPRFVLADNPLFDASILNYSTPATKMSDILQNAFSAVTGPVLTVSYDYQPFTVVCLPCPWVEPTDWVTVYNKSGASVSTVVTHTRFVLNECYLVECAGQINPQLQYS